MGKVGKVRSVTMRRLLVAVVVLVASLALDHSAPTPVAKATGSSSISLDEPFTGATLATSTSAWISIRGGSNDVNEWPCLTAATVSVSASQSTIEACVNQGATTSAAVGEGALRLTRNRGVGLPTNNSSGAGTLLYNATLSALEGIDISFSIRMDDGQAADGMSFFLKDGANVTNSSGTAGGALGYGLRTDVANSRGVPGALFGIGFDRYGNFSSQWIAQGCGLPNDHGLFSNYLGAAGAPRNNLVLRGPDTSGGQDGSTGYCFLATTNVSYSSTAFQRVRVVVPPYTSGQPTTVSVYVAPDTTPDVLPTAPTLTSTVTISADSFKFGFSASTGYWSSNHDLRGLVIRPAGPTITGVTTTESTGSGSGPTTGGTLLTITGTGIDPAATVTVDGQPCTGVNVTGGGTQLTCTTPPGTLGAKQVVVTNANGGPGFGVFTYVEPSVALPPPPSAASTTTTTTPSTTTTTAPSTTTRPPTTTTVPPAPVPAPQGDLPALGSTEALVTEGGEPVAVELVVENDQALVLRSQDFELRLRGACTTGCTITEDTTGRETIHLDRTGGAVVSGFGFLPGSLVHVWIFSEPHYLGALLVAADGTYEGTFPLDDIEVGGHTLQANGFSFDNQPRSANLGIVVVDNGSPTPGPTALPATGTNSNGTLWAAILIAAGIALITPARRRRGV